MAASGRKNADDALLMALACGATVENAAKKAGVSERTAHRRLGNREFLARLKQLKGEMVQRAADMLTAATLESAKTLLALQNESQPAAVRLGAARAVVALGVKLRESAELEERIAELEQRMDASDDENMNGHSRRFVG